MQSFSYVSVRICILTSYDVISWSSVRVRLRGFTGAIGKVKVRHHNKENE